MLGVSAAQIAKRTRMARGKVDAALDVAGSELAIVVRDIGDKKSDFYVMLIVAAFAMWHMGAAFLVGVILDNALNRGWIKI